MKSQIGTTNIPDLIREKLIEINRVGQELTDLEQELEYEKSKIFIQICEEKDAAGKPLFSNDKMRDAEAFKRQFTGIADAVRLDIKEKKTRRAVLSAELETLKLKFKIFQLDRELEIAVLGVEAGIVGRN